MYNLNSRQKTVSELTAVINVYCLAKNDVLHEVFLKNGANTAHFLVLFFICSCNCLVFFNKSNVFDKNYRFCMDFRTNLAKPTAYRKIASRNETEQKP